MAGVLAVAALLAAVSAAAAWWFYSHGHLLYYGDAAAHLNIARRFVDTRTPDWNQIGTVWLPLPHLLMIPFVKNDQWWRSGLAGTFPTAACFVMAGAFLFAALRRALSSPAAALAATLVFALNPNLLYLQATAMTEAVFFAALGGTLYFTLVYSQSHSWPAVAGAALSVLAATLTRYEGWLLIPLVALFFLLAAPKHRLAVAVFFGVMTSLGALWWLGHNWWYWGDALEFYRGPYSAGVIDAGAQRYWGHQEWGKAWLYFRTAARLCVATPLFWLGSAGLLAAFWKRAFWPALLLALPPGFLLLSLYSAGRPIYVPELAPHSYYNTRYGLEALPLLALGAGALVAVIPRPLRGLAALVVVAACVSPWIGYPRAENWICWKESQVNSEARRAWTHEAAQFFRDHYRPEDRVLASFGDLTEVFREAGIPLRETLHDGAELEWLATLGRPDLWRRAHWAMAISGDQVSEALQKAHPPAPYLRFSTITVPGGPAIEIYRRKGP